MREIREILFVPLLGTVLVLFSLAARDLVATGWPWLAYNVALAWVPLILSLAASRHPALLVLLGIPWLLFLPNAPYLITDLVHLSPRREIPYWYDALVLGSTGLLGMWMGVLSLKLVADALSRFLTPTAGRALWLTVPPLVGLGIYLGRFLRWNSWDLWYRPRAVLGSVLDLLLDPMANARSWMFIVAFSAAFLAACLLAPLTAKTPVRATSLSSE